MATPARPEPPEPPPPDNCAETDSCLARALAHRADHRASQVATAAAEAAVRTARAGRRPTLAVQASYGGRWAMAGADQPAGTADLAGPGRVGLLAELPVWDGQVTAARVAEQEARWRGARERQRKRELQIHYEVETALSDVATARERVSTSERAVGQAEEGFRIVQEKYALSQGTLSEVLDAQTALVTAQTSRARARADLAVALSRRRLALGEILP